MKRHNVDDSTATQSIGHCCRKRVAPAFYFGWNCSTRRSARMLFSHRLMPETLISPSASTDFGKLSPQENSSWELPIPQTWIGCVQKKQGTGRVVRKLFNSSYFRPATAPNRKTLSPGSKNFYPEITLYVGYRWGRVFRPRDPVFVGERAIAQTAALS